MLASVDTRLLADEEKVVVMTTISSGTAKPIYSSWSPSPPIGYIAILHANACTIRQIEDTFTTDRDVTRLAPDCT